MRILLDEEEISWDDAWKMTIDCFAYTNHTLMPEAIERWPVYMIENLLPRHLQIIYEINSRHLENIRQKYPNDNDRIRRMSIIEEGPVRLINMAFLSIIGSHTINGVAQIHSRLLRESMFKDFYDLTPSKFQNKTNGVTFRRWLALCNPELFSLIVETIGEDFIRTDFRSLQKLRRFSSDPKLISQLQQIKLKNKMRLAQMLREEYNVEINVESMFDIQIKRIHEYKRALLCLLHGSTLTFSLISKRFLSFFSDYVVQSIEKRKFSRKIRSSNDYYRWKSGTRSMSNFLLSIELKNLRSGYAIAKKIIKLINDVALVINNDRQIGNRLKLLFVKNYRVTAAEYIIPAADLSEQISLAGTEASGTGNMKCKSIDRSYEYHFHFFSYVERCVDDRNT